MNPGSLLLAIAAMPVVSAAMVILRELVSLLIDMRTGRARLAANAGRPRLPGPQHLRALVRLRPISRRRRPLPAAEDVASVSPQGAP